MVLPIALRSNGWFYSSPGEPSVLSLGPFDPRAGNKPSVLAQGRQSLNPRAVVRTFGFTQCFGKPNVLRESGKIFGFTQPWGKTDSFITSPTVKRPVEPVKPTVLPRPWGETDGSSSSARVPPLPYPNPLVEMMALPPEPCSTHKQQLQQLQQQQEQQLPARESAFGQGERSGL